MYPLSQRVTRPAFDLISPFLALPEVRAVWAFSSVNESGALFDLSGQARTLTANGALVRLISASFVNYAQLDGAADYYSRADEGGLSITGSATYVGWFLNDTISAGVAALVSKGTGTETTTSYQIVRSTASLLASVGSGTASNTLSSSMLLTASQWFYSALVYSPSAELSIYHNLVKSSLTSCVIGSLTDNAAAFTLGAFSTPANYHSGRITIGALCAKNLPDILIQSVFQQTRSFFDV